MPTTDRSRCVDITASGVKFKLLGGYVIGTDQTTFVANLKEPTEVTLVDPDTSDETTYTINVLQIVYEVVGTSGGGTR